MIDIHTHILPGVDDGAKDLSESIAIAQKLFESGITTAIATPHYLADMCQLSPQETDKRVKQLQRVLDDEGIGLKVLPGAEVFLTADLGKRLAAGELPTLNHSRYILVELPMKKIPSFANHVFYDILVMDYIPIIAHPERYPGLFEKMDYLKAWLREGVLLQLNSGSLLGAYGARVKTMAQALLKNMQIHFIASDIHRRKQYNRCIVRGIEQLKKLGGPDKNYLCHNAEKIINNWQWDLQKVSM